MEAPGTEPGLLTLLSALGVAQLVCGAFLIPVLTPLRLLTGGLLAQHTALGLAALPLALGWISAAEGAASVANWWVVRRVFGRWQACFTSSHSSAVGKAGLVKDVVAAASWRELALVTNVPLVALLLAPSLPLRRFALAMWVGRLPAQVAHAAAGCALVGHMGVLMGGDIVGGSAPAGSAHPAVVATGALLGVASLLGLALLARRAAAVYKGLLADEAATPP